MSNSHKLPFSLSNTQTIAPFQLVHMDVWGPSPVASNKGFKYYLLVIDDFCKIFLVVSYALQIRG